MRNFLFVDRDEDIRHYVSHCEDLGQDKDLNIQVAASIQEAEGYLSREAFDGIDYPQVIMAQVAHWLPVLLHYWLMVWNRFRLLWKLKNILGTH